MSRRRRILLTGRLALCLGATLLAGAAPAHLMPEKQGTLNLVGDAVFAVLSVPVSALHGFDDDGDGLLSLDELRRHHSSLEAEIDRRFALFDGEMPGQTVRVDLVLSPPHQGPSDRASQVIMLKHVKFESEPRQLRLACDLFGARGEERQLTITATRHPASGAELEAAILTPLSPEHRFFSPALDTLGASLRTGIEHILFGADHLLFLLTVIVAGLGWRTWLSVVTGFTVAHSITLGAAMLGLVHVSPRIVEPLIALSIVVMALDNLVRASPAPRQRLLLVFACGLLHGLGFAASMDALGLDTRHRLLGLLGFNLGVEVGQAIFLCAVLAALLASRKLLPRLRPLRLTQSLSLVAAGVGSFWVLQRVAG